jgi:hypothetical protein
MISRFMERMHIDDCCDRVIRFWAPSGLSTGTEHSPYYCEVYLDDARC